MILTSDLKWYGSATHALDDVTTEVGGAIDYAKKPEFFDVSGALQIISSENADTAQVTVHFKDAAGSVLSDVKSLSGLTPVGIAAANERILRGVKGGSTTGWVAVESATGERAGTAQSGGVDYIVLDAGASAVNGYYVGMVVRLTSGTGANQIRQGVAYDGTTKKLTVNHAWTVNPDGTSAFRVAKGMVFDKAPHEITTVLRSFYLAGADPSGGSTKTYVEKIFGVNAHPTQTLTSAKVIQSLDPSGTVTFALATTKGDTGTNGAGNNRQIAPTSGVGTFDDADKPVPTGSLAAGESIGVWQKLTLADGQAAANTFFMPMLKGSTS